MSYYFNHGVRTPAGDAARLNPQNGRDPALKTRKCVECGGTGRATAYKHGTELHAGEIEGGCGACLGRGFIIEEGRR